MDHYVGLEVLVRSTSICILSAAGRVVREGKVECLTHFDRERAGQTAPAIKAYVDVLNITGQASFA